MYHLENSKLRVCGRYIRQQRNIDAFKQSRIIILQHILKDTEDLIDLLFQSSAEIFAIIAKPYSIDQMVMDRLEKKFKILKNSYNQLEETTVLDELLLDAVEASKKDGKKIVLIDVGGYFAKPLTKISEENLQFFAGIVEDTTFGHNRYKELVNNINIPIFSVARSPLKKIEARFVGDSAVSAMTELLRNNGSTLSSRNALVVGYGMIGQNIAHSLRASNVRVSVYDKDDYRNLSAFSKGFNTNKKIELLKKSDIIFSSTGTNALSLEDIENCKSGCILVSVGSKDIEFDVNGLRDLAIISEKIDKSGHIEKFTIPSGNTVYLIKDGTAVNFLIKSVPDEIIDLVFSEIIICTVLLLKKIEEQELHQINTVPINSLNTIAKDWIKDINR